MPIFNIFNRVLMLIAGLALVAMVIQIGVAVVSRSLFNAPLYGTLEIVTYYYMVTATILPLAAVQVAKEHVIVEVFTQKLRSSVRNKLDFFAAILAVVYLAVLAWACLEGAIRAFQTGEYRNLYAFSLIIWPARWILFFGIVGIMLAIISQLIARDYATSDADE